jgi:hypothetical protein
MLAGRSSCGEIEDLARAALPRLLAAGDEDARSRSVYREFVRSR